MNPKKLYFLIIGAWRRYNDWQSVWHWRQFSRWSYINSSQFLKGNLTLPSTIRCTLVELHQYVYMFRKQSNENPTKWPNTLKQFVGKLPTNCLSVFGHFVNLALKGLTAYGSRFQETLDYLQLINDISYPQLLHKDKIYQWINTTVFSCQYGTFCPIWYLFFNFKSMKNTHGGVLLLVKLQAKACNFT